MKVCDLRVSRACRTPQHPSWYYWKVSQQSQCLSSIQMKVCKKLYFLLCFYEFYFTVSKFKGDTAFSFTWQPYNREGESANKLMANTYKSFLVFHFSEKRCVKGEADTTCWCWKTGETNENFSKLMTTTYTSANSSRFDVSPSQTVLPD